MSSQVQNKSVGSLPPFKYSMALIVSLPIGTSPQAHQLVLDTGSQLSWIQCHRKAPRQPPPPASFDPSRSSSFSPLQPPHMQAPCSIIFSIIMINNIHVLYCFLNHRCYIEIVDNLRPRSYPSLEFPDWGVTCVGGCDFGFGVFEPDRKLKMVV
ncbi:hypothetical protein ACS0TY_006788 [Phlomoides rotata]